jgi:hypothetical protein
MDVSITKMYLDTSTLAKSIMGRREYYTCKPKHYTTIFYYLSLHCIFPRHKIFSGAVAIEYLLILIAYFILVLYTYTHFVFDNHLVRLRAQSKFILFCRLLEEG